jgi:hypothetical protein
VPPLLTLHNFVCPEGHTLAQTRDQKCICDGQQHEILTERDFLCVQEDNGLVGLRRKRCVDMSDRVQDTTSDFIRLDRLLLQTHINFPRFLPIFPDFLERLSHLAPIY